MPDIRVMLVDDSLLFTMSLKKTLEKEPGIMVAGTATNGQDALDKISAIRPDEVVCDVNMPVMDGIQFVKKLLPIKKVPVVVISSTPDATLSALSGGAVDFINKPAAGEPIDVFFKRLITTVRTAAVANVGAKVAVKRTIVRSPGQLTLQRDNIVVAIGASTGGTDAILEVVRGLPENFPPILITQHMPAGFTAMYAERMNRECKMRVREVRDGDRLERGLILLAAGDYQLRLCKDASGYYASSKPGEKVSGHIPSVDVLFGSVAEVAGAASVGVILTGMGADGAKGLLSMRKAGAFTIGQDKDTSVVYGMPMVAFNNGAVVRQLPLQEIPTHLIAHLNKLR